MTRNIYLDIVKGVAIVLVVFGHCLQFGTSLAVNDQYFLDPVFKAIYSFHMPLFMLVSGYLFYGSLTRHTFRFNLRTRVSGLVVPIVVWVTITLLLSDFLILRKGGNISIQDNLLSYLTFIWFLWSIFWCSLSVMIINKSFNDSIIVYIVFGVLLLFLPDGYGINYHVYMYPYFVIGYLWNKKSLYAKFAKSSRQNKIYAFGVSLLIFVALYLHFTKEDYIYTSGTCALQNINGIFSIDTHQIGIDIFRYAIGLAGSVCMLIILKPLTAIMHNHVKVLLSELGKKSIGIYIISVVFINYRILRRLPIRDSLCYSGGVIETVAVLAVTYLVTLLLEKKQRTRKLFLGSR